MRRSPILLALLALAIVPPLPAAGQSGLDPTTGGHLPSALREGPHHIIVDGVRLWYRSAGTSPPGTPRSYSSTGVLEAAVTTSPRPRDRRSSRHCG